MSSRLISCFALFVAFVFSGAFCFGQNPELYCGRAIAFSQAEPMAEMGALADLDADGDQDYVFVTLNSNRVRVFLNDGQGNGQLGEEFAVASAFENLTNLAVADMDGDSDLDIVVANASRSEIVLYLNSGNGSFNVASQPITVIGEPKYFSVADVNNDSKMDVVCVTSSALRVYLNIGAASFIATSVTNIDDEPTSLAVGDINGDSSVDVVVGAADGVSVFENNGIGSFVMTAAFVFPGPSESLLLFDKDGDADLDLAIGNHSAGNIAIYRNQEGVFVLEQELYGGFQIHSQIVAGDISGDAEVDLVIRGLFEVFALYGDGDGGFAPAISIANQQVQVIAIGDVDGDFDLDIASEVAAFVNEGQGRFGDPFIYFPSDEETTEVWAVITVDVDGDNDEDLIYAQSGNRIGIRRNNGFGEFPIEETYDAPAIVQSIVAEDFNGDGLPELAYVTGSIVDDTARLLIRTNAGDGTFSIANASFELPIFPQKLVACRLDGNDSIDLAVSTWVGDVVFTNTGNGFFCVGYTRDANSRWVAEGDINGDGITDLVVGQNNGFAILTNNGNANFSSQVITAQNVRGIELVDVDHDNDLDIAIAGPPTNNHAAIYFNDGNGLFDRFEFHEMGESVDRIQIVDVDGDSILDLTTNSRDFFSVRFGTGNGNFGDRQQYLATGDFVTADLNNDARADFVFAETGCQILLNSCVGRVSLPLGFSVFRGELLNGEIEDLFYSDDSKANFAPGFTLNGEEAPVWVILDGVVQDIFSVMELSIETNGSSPNLERTIEMWNWNTQSYDAVDVSEEFFPIDSTLEIDLSTGILDFVHPTTRETRARVGWRQVGFVISFPWQVSIDRLQWQTQ